MSWTVTVPKKVAKQLSKLPTSVREEFAVLFKEIEVAGPVRGNWPNYSKLSHGEHHCHLRKNRKFVAVWRETAKGISVEVDYAGDRKDAPY